MFFSPKIAAVAFLGLFLAGCATTPEPAAKPVSPANNEAAKPATNAVQSVASPANSMENLQAELEKLAAIDPVAHDEIVRYLQQCDPAIQPLAFEQYRAAREYRRRAQQRNRDSELVRRLPATGAVVQASHVEGADEWRGDCPDFCVGKNGTVPFADTWRDRLAGAIQALEAETTLSPETESDRAKHARLRLLYAAAGRREDAARPIPNATPSVQRFVSKGAEGIAAWLDVERFPDPVRRAAETKTVLADSLAALGETAPLLIHNMTFCSEVFSFGHVKRFEKSEFFQNQDLLLYAELENFTSESTAQGYRTSLRSGYQILDELGAQIARRDFTATEELCRNIRRDFFLAYWLRLPNPMKPGKYTLRLVVADARSQKTGQAAIDFTVKEGKAPEIKSDKSDAPKKEKG